MVYEDGEIEDGECPEEEGELRQIQRDLYSDVSGRHTEKILETNIEKDTEILEIFHLLQRQRIKDSI